MERQKSTVVVSHRETTSEVNKRDPSGKLKAAEPTESDTKAHTGGQAAGPRRVREGAHPRPRSAAAPPPPCPDSSRGRRDALFSAVRAVDFLALFFFFCFYSLHTFGIFYF